MNLGKIAVVLGASTILTGCGAATYAGAGQAPASHEAQVPSRLSAGGSQAAAEALAAPQHEAIGAIGASRVAAPQYSTGTNLPPRVQWNANDGYCGEVALISAGLYYGQYMSQWDARAIASKGAPQNLASSQLLLGVNDTYAADQMRLTATAFNTARQTSTAGFLTWVKGNVMAGYPVLVGVLANAYLFEGSTNPNAGSYEYDHIVPVTAISSTHDLVSPAVCYSDDTLTLSDNGLWTGTSTQAPSFLFRYPCGSFAATRAQANARTGPVYSLSSARNNYGLAVTGVVDQSRETVPVRLTTSVNAETPSMRDGTTSRPAAQPITLTIKVSSLVPGAAYNLYRYNNMAAVPTSSINASASRAAQRWAIKITSGSTYTMTQSIMSNEIAVYRAVPAAAP